MELVLVVFVVMVVFFIGYVVGAKQMSKAMLDTIDDEFPVDQLLGDKERALHIAGIKEASPKQIAEWQNDKRVMEETKNELSMDSLLSKLNKVDLQIKAGIIENTDKTGADIKIKIKEIDAIAEEKMKREAARKQAEKDREERLKIDFEALPMSRISNEARKQITEIVKLDLENKLKEIEKNTPEINENNEAPKQKNKRSENKNKNRKSTPH